MTRRSRRSASEKLLFALEEVIARQHERCEPKRVGECYGCACRKDARRQLLTALRSRAARQ
jgi:hypothetical protein